MKIGYVVEGTIDRGVVHGLAARWCRGAELVEGSSRGQTKLALRREIEQVCTELQLKGARFFVFLTDSDEDDWQERRSRELGLVPAGFRDFAVYGVAERNVECWLRADTVALAEELGLDRDDLARADDPKGLVERALDDLAAWGKEQRIEGIVRDANLGAWLGGSRSFERFYEDARAMAIRAGCGFPNERER